MLRRVALEHDVCYSAVRSRDPRFDGLFFTAVLTTGIYCRTVCPAQTPRSENVVFYATAAAAEAAGFRACRRCKPAEAPGVVTAGSGHDIAARALRLIAAGVADGEAGIGAVAARLGISERHLHRTLVAAVGAGAGTLAGMRRLQAARSLLEQTSMPVTDVALAAGYGSLRQFNDSIRAALGRTPTEVRRRDPSRLPADGAVVLRLSVRPPFDGASLLAFLRLRAVPGTEHATATSYATSLPLAHGAGVVELTPAESHVGARLWLDDMRDLAAAVERCRRVLDLDADPQAIAAVLGRDRLLRAAVRQRPGLRVPGAADPGALAVRAVLGQQVSVAGARTIAGRLVARHGTPLRVPAAGVTHLFPEPEALAGASLEGLGLTTARARTVALLAAAIDRGGIDLDGGDTDQTSRGLQAIPGIGAWTASYVAMRALHDPDAFPAGDLGLRRAFESLRHDTTPLLEHAERWRPWRAYAAMHLWTSVTTTATARHRTQETAA